MAETGDKDKETKQAGGSERIGEGERSIGNEGGVGGMRHNRVLVTRLAIDWMWERSPR